MGRGHGEDVTTGRAAPSVGAEPRESEVSDTWLLISVENVHFILFPESRHLSRDYQGFLKHTHV